MYNFDNLIDLLKSIHPLCPMPQWRVQVLLMQVRAAISKKIVDEQAKVSRCAWYIWRDNLP
jgi:hypothetical protein